VTISGGMKISRALTWAFRVALVLLWLALSLKYWMIAGVLSPVVLALTLWAVGAGGARCARTILTQAPLCGSSMHALAWLYPRRLSFASLESCRACACQDESTEQVGFITGSLCCAPQENRMSDFRFGSKGLNRSRGRTLRLTAQQKQYTTERPDERGN
jgi:hypothetical protein